MCRSFCALVLCATLLGCGRTQLIPCPECRGDSGTGNPADGGPQLPRFGDLVWIHRLPAPPANPQLFDATVSADAEGNPLVSVANDFGMGPWNYVTTSDLHRFSADGQPLWSRTLTVNGGVMNSVHLSLPDGSFFLAGTVYDSQPEPASFEFDGPVHGRAFLLRATADGHRVWTKSWKPTGGYAATFDAIVLAPDGTVAVLGSFNGTLDLGGGPVTATTPIAADGYGISLMLVRFDLDGNLLSFIEIRRPEGGNAGAAEGLAADSAGNLHLGGCRDGSLELQGVVIPMRTPLPNPGLDYGCTPFWVEVAPDGGVVASDPFQGSGGYVDRLSVNGSGAVALAVRLHENFVWNGLEVGIPNGTQFPAQFSRHADGGVAWAQFENTPWQVDSVAVEEGGSTLVGDWLRGTLRLRRVSPAGKVSAIRTLSTRADARDEITSLFVLPGTQDVLIAGRSRYPLVFEPDAGELPDAQKAFVARLRR